MYENGLILSSQNENVNYSLKILTNTVKNELVLTKSFIYTLYEYYAIKSTNADQYKVPLPDIKKQIFDGDTVTLTKMFAGTYTYSEFKQEELI